MRLINPVASADTLVSISIRTCSRFLFYVGDTIMLDGCRIVHTMSAKSFPSLAYAWSLHACRREWRTRVEPPPTNTAKKNKKKKVDILIIMMSYGTIPRNQETSFLSCFQESCIVYPAQYNSLLVGLSYPRSECGRRSILFDRTETIGVCTP